MFVKYGTFRANAAHGDGANAFIWLYMILKTVYWTADLVQMPVFAPNEYFWQHHVREGEERWEAYARVVREIIREQGGFELYETSMEEKFEYKRLFKGKRAAQTAPAP